MNELSGEAYIARLERDLDRAENKIAALEAELSKTKIWLKNREETLGALWEAPSTVAEIARLEKMLTNEQDQHAQTCMNAYKWMERHDALLGFVQKDPERLKAFLEWQMPPMPSPADLPKALAAAEAKLKTIAEGFIDATAHLVGATSAYETFAGNSKRTGKRDALYNTRLNDFKKACERARATYKKFFLSLKDET